MYLFFDVETAGLPRKWNAHYSDTFNWPRMVEIAWILFDENRKLLESQNYIIQPEGFEIPYEAERIHGISTEKAKEEGVPLKDALIQFAKAVDKSEYAIAHNINFDANVLGAEFIRKSVESRLFETDQYCTMRESTWYCKLPGKQGRYKWPTLQELHLKVFGEKFDKAHSALADTEACARCFFKLLDVEAIELF